MHPVTRPTFRVKPYAHPKYKFVVRAKLAGKWKRSYFKSEAEAAAYASKQNVSLEKRAKRQRSGRVRSDGHTNGASNLHELEKSNRRSTVSSQALSRKAVVVLGMHRSGTSALCGALNLLGVDFGKHLMPADKWNPTGYWEHAEIVHLHDELLQALGSSWVADQPLPADWLEREAARETQSSLLSILKDDFQEATVMGLKDPRMCRLLPLWFPLFQKLAIDPCFALIIRHPWKVASSLAKRDDLGHGKSYLLWLQHTLEAESATRGHKRAIVDYGELLKEPVAVLRRLRSELELKAILPTPSTVQKSLREFLQSSLRHQNETRREDEDINPTPPLVLEAYKTMREAIRTKENSKRMSRTQLARSTKFFQARLAASRAPFIHRYFGYGWEMHLPFAYDLMREFRPKVFVELGVYKGESYFTFCQSVEENGVATQCYGIDTWRGDVHTGIYGPEIGNEVVAYNSRYSRFSHLMAMTFKEAAGEFSDGSIDLLHIDGTHRYEDVKKDFETWLPKLSQNGIILFHDVTAHVKGFGVDKLWREIARPRTSFLFEFGYGLGVWRRTPVSKSDPPFLRRLFLANSKEKRAITNKYAMKAWAVELSASPQPKKADQRDAALTANNAEFQRLNTHIEQISAAVHRSEEELKQRDAALTANNAEFQRLNTHIEQISAAVHRSKEELKQRDATLAANNIEFQRLLKERAKSISDIQAQLAEAQRHHDTEIEQVRERFAQANRLLHSKNVSLAESEALVSELTTRLRQQLHDAKKLTRLLGSLEDATARLGSSRRWKLANPIVSLRNTFLRGGEPVGYDHLDKVVAEYQRWRSAHPELQDLDEQIQQLRRAALKGPKTEPATSAATLPFAEVTSGNGFRASEHAEAVLPPAPKPIEFPLFDKIEVSIIIPVFNQFHFTQACLASLREHRGSHAIEVIVVDDGSSDETADFVPRIKGIVYLRNETNAGFVSSCNRGAAKARGEYLLFLNNDTTVKPGWLNALLETFQLEPRAGLVGSKLLFPDGRLQEAGGIIWRDGSGWNRGKFCDPENPEYNFLREVDYCSAACVMVPRSLFQSVGGFDRKFAPAYYEDADLAFKLQHAGFKILYQPLSEIIHYEGATGGTDLSTGTKKYQEINRTAFLNVWADVLAEKPANGDLASYQQLAPGQKRILVIDHYLPMPDRDAGSLRMFHILHILHQLGHWVTFVPDNMADIPPYADELQKRGVEVVYHPYIKSVRDYLEKEGHKFDVVILSRCDFAKKHIADVRLHAPQSRIIFDTVDLHFLRTDREAQIRSDPEIRQKARENEQLEYDLIDQADETWVVSGVEQKLLREKRPDKSIEIVPTIVDVPGSNTPFSLRRDFLFIGGFQHTPNGDAVIFFLEKIYPLVREHLSDVKFYIIGDKVPPEVVALATDNIIVTGLQPDVRPFFESVKLSVAPLRYGAGIKGKINQSLGFGVPVVATSLAVEGMALTDHEDILIADEPKDFAHALVELYESEQLWNRLSANGIKETKAHYSVSAVRKRLSHLFSDKHSKLPQGRKLRTLTTKIASTQSTS
jgi:GT2 family glycosyltransferase/glycosyltransferase involved in cell wall biosynthesis